MANKLWQLFVFPTLTCLALSGCGGSGKARVKGVVTLDGKPVDSAGVRFVPLGDHPHPAYATTDEDGSFDMTSNEPGDGVWPGEDKVCVTKRELGDKALAKLEKAKGWESRKILAGPRTELLPTAYGDEKRTPFHVTVPPPGSIKLELTSNGP
jgi:hypothetical protein